VSDKPAASEPEATKGADAVPKATKQERALALAKARYVPKRASRWPYLLRLRDDQKFSFEGPDRKALRADLRLEWRGECPDGPPADSALNSVIDDLKRLALDVEADPVSEAEQQTAEYPPGPSDDRGLALVLAHDGCPLPDGYQIPGDYEVRPDGIWYLEGRWGPCRAAWAWLFPVCVYIDPNGNQWLELAWRDERRWVSRLVRRSITKSGRKLITETGDAGMPVTDSEARDAEKWIAAAEAANHDVISRHPVARQLGWQADHKTFVTAQDTPWRVEPKYEAQAAALTAHRPAGTLAGWQKAIEHARPYPVVRMGIYAGLAAPLLNVLGVDSGTIDVAYKSTRGKSITGMAAISPWADPSDTGDAILSWSATIIEIEKRLNLVSGMLVVLDESRLVKDPGNVDTVIYQVPKNRGKARGGGWPSMLPWRCLLFSTGEQPATSFTTHQGASARVLSTGVAPFGPESDEGRTAAEAVKRGLEANYGTAGPLFISRLQGLLAEEGGAGRLRKRHAELIEKLRGTTDMSGRRAPLLAVIALAAELAAKWKITPFPVPEPAAWLAMFAAADPRDNRAEMALEIVREFIAAHQDKLYTTKVIRDHAGNPLVVHPDHAPATGWIGHEAKEGPALLPEHVREELKHRGYDLDAVLPGWLEMGALVTRDKQQPPHLINRRTAGRQSKHIIFKREVLDDGADSACVL
jgi:hypothetical protein